MHELSEKLWAKYMTISEVDSIIVQYLKEKADEFEKLSVHGYDQRIHKILGLESQEKESYSTNCGCTVVSEGGTFAKKFCLRHEPKTIYQYAEGQQLPIKAALFEEKKS